MTKDQTDEGKHFLNDPTTLVSDSIQGLCYAYPHLRLLPDHKVVYDSDVNHIANKQVTLVFGGGSGHEPAASALVGSGMLTAAVCGHVFASPSANQVLAALEQVKSPFGTLVIVMNYTGDCLHFGLAVERAKARGIKVNMIIVGDDISVGRRQGRKVGRRGMAVTALVVKVCGALAATGASLEQVAEIGQYVIDHGATLGVALNHCHVPGSSSNVASLAPLELELGMGIHNEPGLSKMPWMPANELVNHMLKMLIDQDDHDRAYLSLPNVTDQTDDGSNLVGTPTTTTAATATTTAITSAAPVVLLVNNYGGTPSLEFNVVVKEAVEFIHRQPHLRLERVISGSFVTSLNAIGFSLSLLTLGNNLDLLLKLLDYPVRAPGWPMIVSQTVYHSRIPNNDQNHDKNQLHENTRDNESKSMADNHNRGSLFSKVLSEVTQALIQAEPKVTEIDTILGDGDCGHTLKSAAEAIDKEMSDYPFSSTEIAQTILDLADTIDRSVGGTSSAIYCIFLNALANGLNKFSNENQQTNIPVDIWAKACSYALAALQVYTQARVGDRTMMDALIPFVETLNSTLSLEKATVAAEQGMLKTQYQLAQLGRASYLSNEDVLGAGIPDAGAYGLVKLFESMVSSLK